MNLSIYLSQKLASKLSLVAEQQHATKNAIVKEALEEWLSHHHPSSSWAPHFFEFEEVKEAHDFSIYRTQL